ncbi:hypothetical protein STEG23_013344, partial [Scotinomys teguina]
MKSIPQSLLLLDSRVYKDQLRHPADGLNNYRMLRPSVGNPSQGEMKKSVYDQDVGDQEREDVEGEENRNNADTSGLLYNEADRCPICLSCLLGKEVGFPESCNHVFCMTCLLKWAEILASCPIDRKPFQAVFELSAFEDCAK